MHGSHVTYRLRRGGSCTAAGGRSQWCQRRSQWCRRRSQWGWRRPQWCRWWWPATGCRGHCVQGRRGARRCCGRRPCRGHWSGAWRRGHHCRRRSRPRRRGRPGRGPADGGSTVPPLRAAATFHGSSWERRLVDEGARRSVLALWEERWGAHRRYVERPASVWRPSPRPPFLPFLMVGNDGRCRWCARRHHALAGVAPARRPSWRLRGRRCCIFLRGVGAAASDWRWLDRVWGGEAAGGAARVAPSLVDTRRRCGASPGRRWVAAATATPLAIGRAGRCARLRGRRFAS